MSAENDIVEMILDACRDSDGAEYPDHAQPWGGLDCGDLRQAAAEIVRLRGEVCSCPSGDGSLRWPCKAHPPGAIAPAEAKVDCQHLRTTASADGMYEFCDLCKADLKKTPQPADGGAVAYWVPNARAAGDGSWEDGPGSLVHAADASDYEKRIGTPLYTHPPAAQVQQKEYQPVRFGGIRRPSDAALAAAFWEHRQRENSLPVALCDSKLVKFGNDIVQRARELAPHVDTHPAGDALGAVTDEMVERVAKAIFEDQCPEDRWSQPMEPDERESWRSGARKAIAALQHRGDSQEVSRG